MTSRALIIGTTGERGSCLAGVRQFTASFEGLESPADAPQGGERWS